MYVTNPIHGGKVVCYQCGKFILEDEPYMKYGSEYKHRKHYDDNYTNIDTRHLPNGRKPGELADE